MAQSGTITGSNTPGRRPRVRWSITSQNQAANTSTVQFIVDSQPVSGYSTFGTFSGTLTVDGVNVPISGSVTSGSTNTIQTVSRTITHASNGTKTVAVSLSGGISGTTGWPTSYSGLSGSAVLDRIPKAPSTPATPTIDSITSSSLRVVANGTPATNGAAIIEYQYQVATNSGFTAGTASQTTPSRSATFTGRPANTQHWARWRARNSVGWGPWSSARTASTAVAAPTAPTNVNVSRSSDTSHTLTWTRNSTGAAPYASQQIQRRVDSGSWSGWATIATVGAAATSFTDASTVANREYLYRVVAVNAGGSAASAASAYIRTSPAAPSGLTAVKDSDDIVVTGTGNAPAVASAPSFAYEWQDNPGGTGWVNVGSPSSGADPSQRFEAVNPAVTHQYRARARVSSGTSNDQTLYSAWSTPSNVVQLQAPPNAPTLLDPISGARDRLELVTFRWQHNPVDTTGQTAFQIRIFEADSPSLYTTYEGGTPQEYARLLPATSGVIRWQVRTKGAHASWSPWSPISMFTLAAKPTAAISLPEPGDLDRSQVGTVAWEYFAADGSPQSQWRVELRDEYGSVLESRTGTGTSGATALSTVLEDQTPYVIAARAQSASGLWSDWNLVEITTAFPLPAKVEIGPTWDRDIGSVALALTPLAPEPGESEVEWVDIQRRIGGEGGEWVTIATRILPDDTIADPLPVIGGVNEYRAISHTSLPSSREGDIAASDEWHHFRCSVYVNTGDGFVQVGHVRGHQSTDSLSIESAAHHFADREKAVAFFGDAEDYTHAFTGTIFDDTTQRDEWIRLLRLKQIACFRDCRGRRIFGILGLSFTTSQGVTQVQISVYEVDHSEAVYQGGAEVVEA